MSTTWAHEVKQGEYQRTERTFRDWVTKDGSSGFKAEANRYHLYVSYACPWAHRTLVMRALKGLEDIISVSIVDHVLDRSKGWSLLGISPDTNGDTVEGFKYLKEAYLKSNPNYTGTITVPVLWDKKEKVIVNNESPEIIRMFNSEFNEWAKNPLLDFCPEELKPTIDELNSWIYTDINNGVYKSGFARTQEAYDVAVKAVFAGLDKVEELLSKNRYLTGNRLTEADMRLWTTLVRFDPVYYVHFKTNLRHIWEYPNIWDFTRELFQMKGVTGTVNMYHIRHHYFESHTFINPYGIIPIGVGKDITIPHERDQKHPFNRK